jgi:gliding motility-associated-like protein
MSDKVNGMGKDNFLTVNAKTTFIGTPQPITICSGASIVIQGDVESPVPNSYSWEVLQGSTWVVAPGAANGADYQPVLLVNTGNSNIIYSIRRKIVTAGATAYDSFYDVTVLTTAAITNNVITSPATAVFCSTGSVATITGSTPTGGIGGFVYQWQFSTDNVNFANIPGANGVDYIPGAVTVTTYYRRVVAASCTVPVISNSISITILSGLSNNVITAPVINSFCLSGDPAAITGNTPSGGSGLYTYQWQSSTDAVNFTDIAGATSIDYDPATIFTTMFYRRLATTSGCAVPVYSNVVIINILPTVTNNVITAPVVASFCVIGSPSAIIGNTPNGGNGGYTYQWQISTDGLTFTDISAATTKDYVPAAINATTYYRRVAVSGSCIVPITSNTITLTITPLPTPPVMAPTSTTICPGSVSTFSIINAQAGAIYNWYDSAAKTNLLYTGTSYTTPPLYTTTILYIENSNGSCSSASSTVQIIVLPPPTAPLLVNSSITTCPGSSATLTLASPQAGYIYNWYTAASGGTPVFTGTSFTTPALLATTSYYVEATSVTGCISTSRTSATVSMPALDPITVQGASVCPGSSATLSATSASLNATMSWYTTQTGGTPIYTGNTFTTPALTVDTRYYVEATNNTTGCISPSRELVQAIILQPLTAPVVNVDAATNSSVTFKWQPVMGATAYLISLDNGATYVSPSTGAAALTETITGLQLNQSVTIFVEAVGVTACQVSPATAATGVTISQTDEIFVPNAFTPNGDGKNDIIYVRSQSIKTLKFYVYSQWGELLFSTTDTSGGWDGTFKGTKEPVGVYVYYLTAEMQNGQEVSKKGTIALLK